MDDSVGYIVSKMKDLGLYDNTIFLFTSDVSSNICKIVKSFKKIYQNGGHQATGGYNKPLARGKPSPYEGGTRVPAFIHYPKVIAPGNIFNGYSRICYT